MRQVRSYYVPLFSNTKLRKQSQQLNTHAHLVDTEYKQSYIGLGSLKEICVKQIKGLGPVIEVLDCWVIRKLYVQVLDH